MNREPDVILRVLEENGRLYDVIRQDALDLERFELAQKRDTSELSLLEEQAFLRQQIQRVEYLAYVDQYAATWKVWLRQTTGRDLRRIRGQAKVFNKQLNQFEHDVSNEQAAQIASGVEAWEGFPCLVSETAFDDLPTPVLMVLLPTVQMAMNGGAFSPGFLSRWRGNSPPLAPEAG